MVREIRTERLLLRCWRPSDAPMLKSAIDESLVELQSWVDWALEHPLTLDVLEARLAGMQARFLRSEDWAFGLFDSEASHVVGGAGLHPRGSMDRLEIGYWIRSLATGRGLAREAASALVGAGFAHTAVPRVQILCDARNTRSAAVATHLGFRLTGITRQAFVTSHARERDTMTWTLSRPHTDDAARP